MGDITPAIHDCSGVYHMEPAEQRGKFFYRSEEGNCKIERSATIPVANPQEQEPVYVLRAVRAFRFCLTRPLPRAPQDLDSRPRVEVDVHNES